MVSLHCLRLMHTLGDAYRITQQWLASAVLGSLMCPHVRNDGFEGNMRFAEESDAELQDHHYSQRGNCGVVLPALDLAEQ